MRKEENEFFLNGQVRLIGISLQWDRVVCKSVKVNMEVQQKDRKANNMRGFIAKGFDYKNTDILL